MGREKQLHRSVLRSLRMLIMYSLFARVRRAFRALTIGMLWVRRDAGISLDGPGGARQCVWTEQCPKSEAGVAVG